MFSYFLAVFGNSCSNTLRLALGSITEELSYRRKSDNCRDIFPVLRFRMLKGKANLTQLFPCTAFHSIHYQLLLSLFTSTSACPSPSLPSLPSADTLGKKEISSRWTMVTNFQCLVRVCHNDDHIQCSLISILLSRFKFVPRAIQPKWG